MTNWTGIVAAVAIAAAFGMAIFGVENDTALEYTSGPHTVLGPIADWVPILVIATSALIGLIALWPDKKRKRRKR